MPAKPKKPVAPWRLKLGKAVPWLFTLFAAGALVQVFFAGYGIENLGAQGMEYHRGFAHVIEVVPLLIILVGFLGADWRGGVWGIVLFVQFQAQYAFLASDLAAVNALHAANGAAMLVVAAVMAHRGMRRVAPATSAKPVGNVVQAPLRPGPPTP